MILYDCAYLHTTCILVTMCAYTHTHIYIYSKHNYMHSIWQSIYILVGQKSGTLLATPKLLEWMLVHQKRVPYQLHTRDIRYKNWSIREINTSTRRITIYKSCIYIYIYIHIHVCIYMYRYIDIHRNYEILTCFCSFTPDCIAFLNAVFCHQVFRCPATMRCPSWSPFRISPRTTFAVWAAEGKAISPSMLGCSRLSLKRL